MLISSILHKRGADFKRFLPWLTGHLQGPDSPDPCGVPSSKTERTKRRNESVSSDYAGLTYPNIILGLWPVYCRFPGVYRKPVLDGAKPVDARPIRTGRKHCFRRAPA